MTQQLFRTSSVTVLGLVLGDLEDLFFGNRSKLMSSGTGPEAYNHSRYTRYHRDVEKAYRELYGFCFMLAKPP